MAQNVPTPVEFLALVTAAGGGPHEARQLAASSAVRRAIEDSGFVADDPQWPPASPEPFAQADWDGFFRHLRGLLANHFHPYETDESLIGRLVDKYVDSVLQAINEAPGRDRQRFRAGRPVTIGDHAQHAVSGVCDYAFWSNDDVCCLFEHRVRQPTDGHFNEAVAQATIQATALRAQRPLRPVLAIVTDLDRWQFLVVDQDGCKRSTVYRVDHGRDGVPHEQQLRNVLGVAVAWLLREWQPHW